MGVTLTKSGPRSGAIAFSTTLPPEAVYGYLADFTKHAEWTAGAMRPRFSMQGRSCSR